MVDEFVGQRLIGFSAKNEKVEAADFAQCRGVAAVDPAVVLRPREHSDGALGIELVCSEKRLCQGFIFRRGPYLRLQCGHMDF